MKILVEEATALMTKYAAEKTPLAATLHTGAAQARVRGFLRQCVLAGSPGLVVGGADSKSDCIAFQLRDCDYTYGDLREVDAETAAPFLDRIEAFLTVSSPNTGEVLMIFEEPL